MIWLIAKRELSSNIITFRFLVSLILCLVLITACVFVHTKDYRIRLKSYSENVSKHIDALQKHQVHYQIRVGVDRPPAPLGFLSVGFDKRLGNVVEDVSYREIPMSAIGQGGNNPLMSVFPSLDIALITRVVLSLLALLLAYDAISGERERGTFALMLSNAVPGYHVLPGKLLGGTISIAIPLAMGMLVGVLIVFTSGLLIMDVHTWARIGMVFLCSLLYLLVIFMLGIFVSSWTRRSSTSLVILLFIWVFLVMLWPNMAPYMARHIREVQDKAVVDAGIWDLRSELNKKTSDYGIPLWKAGKYPPDLWRFMRGEVIHVGHPYPRIVYYAPRENMVWFLEGLKGCLPLHLEYADRIWNLYDSYEKGLHKQASLADSISRISPAWIYHSAASALAGTDRSIYLHFMDQIRQYRKELIDYSRSQKGFSSLSFFTMMRMDETLTFAELVEMESRQGRGAIDRLIEASIEKNWRKGQRLQGIPAFSYQSEFLCASIRRAIPDLMLLLLFNILFFLATYASFMRRGVK